MRLLVVFFLLIQLIAGQEEFLNEENFLPTIKTYNIALVNFYAEWCHFCRQFAPAYSDAASKMSEEKLNKQVLVAKVDCVTHASLCQMYGVNKYPTLKLFRESILQKKEYRGARTSEAVIEYLREQMQPAFKLALPQPGETDITNVHTGYNEAHVLGVFSETQDDAEFQTFQKVASALSGTCKFFVLRGHYPNRQGVYFRDHDYFDGSNPPKSLSLLSLTVDQAVREVSMGCKPMVRELTFDNAEEITEEGIPLLILFYKNGDESGRVQFINLISQQFRHEEGVVFLTAKAETFTHPLAHLEINDEHLPAIVIDSFQHMYKLPSRLKEAVNDPQLLQRFIDDLKSGALHMKFHFGSQEPPQVTGDQAGTSLPPPSVFKKLQPNEGRYSMVHDEF